MPFRQTATVCNRARSNSQLWFCNTKTEKFIENIIITIIRLHTKIARHMLNVVSPTSS